MAITGRTKRGIAAGIAAAMMLTLAGAPARAGDKTGIATLLGATGGAIAGAQFGKGRGQLAAVAVGTLLGAAIGNGFGRSLDRADQYTVIQAHERALNAPVGETIQWHTPNGGYAGTVHTVRDGVSASGAYCREYQTTVMVGGQPQQGYGTACLQPDGAWKIMREPIAAPAPVAPTPVYSAVPAPVVVHHYAPRPTVVHIRRPVPVYWRGHYGHHRDHRDYRRPHGRPHDRRWR